MTDGSMLQLRPVLVVAAAAILVAAGSAATYIAMRPTPQPAAAVTPQQATTPVAPDAKVVTLSPEAIGRAGIETQVVAMSGFGGRLRLPGTVQPNAYRTTVVTPVVGGRITRVFAELGQAVRRGQILAEVYSPDLAEAQTRYVSARAELDAHERELRRTEKLVELGSASRQELERLHAAHTGALTAVQSHRSRLTLLGMTDAQLTELTLGTTVSASAPIPSPLDGVVTTREANLGMNVDPSVPLFTVADLSTVWVVGDLNERDLSRVRVGSPAIITATAVPGVRREGTISYIDPQVKMETRTAQIRVEMANPDRQLRLGMYVDVEVDEGKTGTAVGVPRSAVQVVGNRSVVYVANPAQPGQFVERGVETGSAAGDVIEILNGVSPGELVVTKGSFAVRAEAARQGLHATPRE
jgi:membrane fusion protein, heavy metal efflux system